MNNAVMKKNLFNQAIDKTKKEQETTDSISKFSAEIGVFILIAALIMFFASLALTFLIYRERFPTWPPPQSPVMDYLTYCVPALLGLIATVFGYFFNKNNQKLLWNSLLITNSINIIYSLFLLTSIATNSSLFQTSIMHTFYFAMNGAAIMALAILFLVQFLAGIKFKRFNKWPKNIFSCIWAQYLVSLVLFFYFLIIVVI